MFLPLRRHAVLQRCWRRANSSQASSTPSSISPTSLAQSSSTVPPPDRTQHSTDFANPLFASPAVVRGREQLRKLGFNKKYLTMQTVQWGDLDSTKTVGSPTLAKYFESSRVEWFRKCLSMRVGADKASTRFLSGHGVGPILASMTMRFTSMVTYPDTLIISHRQLIRQGPRDTSTFYLHGTAFSSKYNQVVANSSEVFSWYDHDKRQIIQNPEQLATLYEAVYDPREFKAKDSTLGPEPEIEENLTDEQLALRKQVLQTLSKEFLPESSP